MALMMTAIPLSYEYPRSEGSAILMPNRMRIRSALKRAILKAAMVGERVAAEDVERTRRGVNAVAGVIASLFRRSAGS